MTSTYGRHNISASEEKKSTNYRDHNNYHDGKIGIVLLQARTSLVHVFANIPLDGKTQPDGVWSEEKSWHTAGRRPL